MVQSMELDVVWSRVESPTRTMSPRLSVEQSADNVLTLLVGQRLIDNRSETRKSRYDKATPSQAEGQETVLRTILIRLGPPLLSHV
jgi:hypothetical protein